LTPERDVVQDAELEPPGTGQLAASGGHDEPLYTEHQHNVRHDGCTGMTDVQAWLSELGLPQYCRALSGHNITGGSLLQLKSNDLKTLGITPLSHRRIVLAAIAHLAAGKGQYRRPPGDDLPP